MTEEERIGAILDAITGLELHEIQELMNKVLYWCGKQLSDEGMAQHSDLNDLDEDERVEAIGKTVVESDGTHAFAVGGKSIAERYVKKIQEKFKDVRILEITDNSPYVGACTVKLTRGTLQ